MTKSQPSHTTKWHMVINDLVIGSLLGLLLLAWYFSWQGTLSSNWSRTLLAQSGQMSYLLLAFTSTLGPLIGTRFAPQWLNAAMKTGWHGVASGFALVLGLVHGMFTLVGHDAMTVTQALIPGLSPYKTLTMGLGTAGLWLMALVYLTYALRGKLGFKAARALHLMAYPAALVVTLHAVQLSHGGFSGMYLLGTLSMLLALMVRLMILFSRKNRGSE